MSRGALLAPARARAGMALVLAAAVALRLGEGAGRLPGWAAAWGDDLVCLPLVLAAALLIHRLAGRGAGWRLPAAHGLAAVLLYAACFEILLPAVADGPVADPLDAVAYLAGWLFFQTVINVPGPAPRPAPAA